MYTHTVYNMIIIVIIIFIYVFFSLFELFDFPLVLSLEFLKVPPEIFPYILI